MRRECDGIRLGDKHAPALLLAQEGFDLLLERVDRGSNVVHLESAERVLEHKPTFLVELARLRRRQKTKGCLECAPEEPFAFRVERGSSGHGGLA